MFKRILVAVDGSHTAELALQGAVKLANELGAELRIVHIVDEISLNLPDQGDFEEFRETFRKSSLEILEKTRAQVANARVKAEIKTIEIETFGHRIADMIASEADSWPADVIVVGTHGRRGLHRLLLGSVAEGVARVATKPVLLIRGK